MSSGFTSGRRSGTSVKTRTSGVVVGARSILARSVGSTRSS